MSSVISLLLGLFAGNAVLSQPMGGHQIQIGWPSQPGYGPPPPVQQPGFGYPPQQPPIYPQPGFGGGVPGFGAFNPAFMDPQQLNCEFIGQCRNRRITLTPGHDFQLNCQQPGICDGLDLTLNVGFDPTNPGSGVSQIDGLNFDAVTRGATIRINAIPGQNVEINHLRCNQPGSCTNLNVIAGFGVELWNIQVDCQLGACNNCKVNGMDCNMLSWQHGNNNNMAFGYYNNQPNYGGYGMGGYPQQPQQPGFGGQYGGGYTTNPPPRPQPRPQPQPQPQVPPQTPQYPQPPQVPPATPGTPQGPPEPPQGPPATPPGPPRSQSPPQTNPGGQGPAQQGPAGQGAPSNPNTQAVEPIPPIPPMPQIPPHLNV